MAKEYARPEVLVSTNWVADHSTDTENIRIVESDEDVLLYDTGHIPNAVKIDWINDLQDDTIRDYVPRERFAELCESKGINNDTTVVFYGDKSNWWACYAFWTFKLFGHEKCKIVNGGREKWIAEGRTLEIGKPMFAGGSYEALPENRAIRAFRKDVINHIDSEQPLIDVRSPQEYSGELTHMPDYPQEGALRGGHIPGSLNLPANKLIADDGTMKKPEELKRLFEEAGIDLNRPVATTCGSGVTASILALGLAVLGKPQVPVYDGSWAEWGACAEMPVDA